jgi:hypothetical protein
MPPLLTRMLLLNCGQVPPVDCAPLLAGFALFIDPIAFVVRLVDEVRRPLFFLRHKRIGIPDVCVMMNLWLDNSFVVPARRARATETTAIGLRSSIELCDSAF